MPPNNCDPVLSATNSTADQKCPKCNVEMEPIEAGLEGLPAQLLHLCPQCYMVMWKDADGFHVRQGVPMKKDSETVTGPTWVAGEPEKC